MPKKKFPTPRVIKKVLSESVVDFNAPGPQSIIADSPATYWVPRAIECLRAFEHDGDKRRLQQAIGLIGLKLANG